MWTTKMLPESLYKSAAKRLTAPFTVLGEHSKKTEFKGSSSNVIIIIFVAGYSVLNASSATNKSKDPLKWLCRFIQILRRPLTSVRVHFLQVDCLQPASLKFETGWSTPWTTKVVSWLAGRAARWPRNIFAKYLVWKAHLQRLTVTSLSTALEENTCIATSGARIVRKVTTEKNKYKFSKYLQ